MYFYCIWRQSVRKQIRLKYGLFMQNKFIFKISSFNEKRIDAVTNKQNIFASVETMGFRKLKWGQSKWSAA